MAKLTIDDEQLKTLRAEIKMSEKLNEQELQPQMLEAVQRYTGQWVPEIADNWTLVLNEIYPVIQYNLPAIFFRNPKVFLKPRNKWTIVKQRDPLSGQMVQVQVESQKSARTQEAIINYVLGEIRYKQEIRKVLLDGLLFKYAVLWHGYKGDFGMTEEQSLQVKNDMVFVKRLNPLRFLKDPSVPISQLDEATWTGRSFQLRLQDLLEDDTLDVDKKAIKGKVGFGEKIGKQEMIDSMKLGGLDQVRPRSMIEHLGTSKEIEEFKSSTGSRFVTLYEIFKRPTRKEKRNGQKGKIILLTDEQKKPLRVSNWPYKAEGWPGHILQFNDVPDHMLGLADIETYGAIADHKNLVINQQIRNAEQLNKVWVGINGSKLSSEEDISKIRSGDNTIIVFEDGAANQNLSVTSGAGGSSQELYLLDQRIDRNLQDKSGVSDLKKGFLQSGEESAASVKLRNAGSSARPAYRQDIMADFLGGSVHFIKQLLQQFMPIKDAVRIMGTTDIQWSENPSKEELQADTDVELDVISMLPENPEDEVRNLITILNLAIQGLTEPAVKAKVQSEGKTFNITPIIEQVLLRLRIRDPEVFRGIRPEESEGFASIAELRAAQANVLATFQGQPPPSPPEPGQDHRTRIEVMGSIAQIMQATGQEKLAAALQQIVLLQQQLLQAEEEKENPKSGQQVPRLKPFGQRASNPTQAQGANV